MRIRITFLILIFATLSLNAQYALVDFMYVPEGGDETYVKMEQSYAKPVHQRLIDEDKMNYWGLFRVAYPAGTGADYQYVTVRIYEGADQLANATAFNETFEKVHENEILEALMSTVVNTRDLVETHRLYRWEMFQDPNLKAHPEILQVVYFKNPMPKWEDYQKMEKELFHPMHKKEIEMGLRAGWQGYQLQSPMGSSMPYSHVTVDSYKNWEQYMKPKKEEAVLSAVHPKKTREEINEVFYQTADLVRMEEWHLIDYVQKMPEKEN